MKPLVKKEKSSSSTSEELASQRPKRNTSQKNIDVNNGLLWREETDLKKALYASLQETRKKNFEDEYEEEPEEDKSETPATVNGQDESPKKAKVHAQRKFAQGSTPTSPIPTPQKVPNQNSTTELIPYRRPKTEDFLTFLCLRGTSILPPSLDFLNCCSKSDTSSDCRSLSPELEVNEYSGTAVKVSESREKVNNKYENVPNGLSKKHISCKVSSKKHPDVPLPVKKSSCKTQKEISIVRKRKSRDENGIAFLSTKNSSNVSTSSRTRSSSLYALKEKYKKQRLAAGKKSLLPPKTANLHVSLDKKKTAKPLSVHNESKKNSLSNISTRNQSKSQEVITNKLKSSFRDKKLAIEKRKSLRSAQFSKGLGHKRSLDKKTMWLRRAKLVPPIVDVDSDSEPEIITTIPEKKSPTQKVSIQQESSDKSSKKLRSDPNATKNKTSLTSRQILLRKHMQNRLKAKKSVLHSKNIKSKAIAKKSAAKQDIFKKVRKSIGLKTMSLRKDLQNKRVTRSAKQQIEEMLWANPEKRTRGQNSKPAFIPKSYKRRSLLEMQPVKKQKLELLKTKSDRQNDICDKLTKNKQQLNSDVNKTVKQITSKEKTTIIDDAKSIRRVKTTTSVEVKTTYGDIQSKIKSSSKSKVEDKDKSVTTKPKTEGSKNKIKMESGNLKENKSKSGNAKIEEKLKNENNKFEGKSKSESNKLEGKTKNENNKFEGKSKSENNKLEGKSKSENKLEGKSKSENNNLEVKSKSENNNLEGKLKSENNKLEGKSKSENKLEGKSKIENKLEGKSKKEIIKLDGKSKGENNKLEEKLKNKSIKIEVKSKSESNKLEEKLKNDSTKAVNKDSKTNVHNNGSSKTITENSKLVDGKNLSKKEASKIKTRLLKSETQLIEVNKVIKESITKVEDIANISNSNESTIKCSNSAELSFTELAQCQSVQLNNSDKHKRLETDMSSEVSNINKLTTNNITDNVTAQTSNNFDLSTEFKELNVQNNLNSLKIDKTSDKDISKLMTLNVDCEESLTTTLCEPSTSGLNKSDKNFEKLPLETKYECLLAKPHLFKKHSNKKYIKKSSILKETKSHRKIVDRNKKSQNKSIEKIAVAAKDSITSKKVTSKLSEKLTSKKEFNALKKHSIDIAINMSDSNSSSDRDKIENHCENIESNLNAEKSQKKYQYDVDTSGVPAHKNHANEIVNSKSLSLNSECPDSFVDNQCEIPNLEKKIKNKLNGKTEKMTGCRELTNKVQIESDDDSDNDLTVHQYLKLTSGMYSPSSKINSCSPSTKTETNQVVSNWLNDTKSMKLNKKETEKNSQKDHLIKERDKESQKVKKDGISSKHKKDKEYSRSKYYDKSLKKEDKISKKDADKSLTKLLKKERERSKLSKKEEKSKHKRDGSSSSKSSKREFDKDGSKLRKESEKVNCSSEKQSDKKVDFLESKKDKSKKESSKLSRSNSYEESKSPKKKKKYNELKDIEKIKNMISYSSILNEISGFKSFKRRLSNDKSELKKRLSKKKQKKLALLKDKKVSKKISSKLLRKYSEKKSLKSKKNKLKKKGLKKEMKSSNLSKVHSKKKQKHKMKDHHRRDSQEKEKNMDPSSIITSKVIPKVPSSLLVFENSNFNIPLENTQVNIISSLANKDQISTNDKGTSADFPLENMAEAIHHVESSVVPTDISQSIPANIVFNSREELPDVAAAECINALQKEFPTDSIIDTKDSVCQLSAVQFTQDIPTKTMADAATNTCEEDIDEVLSSIPEQLKNDEMSVGTQTITPAASPAPTFEIRSLQSPPLVESPLANKSSSLVQIHTTPSSKNDEVAISTTPMNTVQNITLPTILELPLPSTSAINSNLILSGAIETLPTVQAANSEKCSLPLTLLVPLPVSTAINSKSVSQTPIEISLPATTSIICADMPQKIASAPPATSSNLKKSNSTNKTESLKTKKKPPKVKKAKVTSINFLKSESFPLNKAKMVSAPVYYPSSEEFKDPLEYISRIYPEAEKYGICKIVPPSSFKPECKVNDDLRFMALNQYLHKMLYRWGPNVQHRACIKKHLKSQKVELEQAPLIGGIELDISKFYHTVQQFGGLQQVIIRKMWQKVADVMHIPKAAQDRVTKLYNAYCKYLVSYDTLPSEEKKRLEEEVIADHNKYIKLRNSKESDKDEELEEEENPECVTKGQSMPLSNFYRIARNTMSMWFKNDHPCPEEVESEFWKIVTERNQHVVVHAGNIDSNTSQSGFPVNKTSFGKHPWNLKVLTNNHKSILRCMGPVSGITSPTLHVGMLFTTSCWYRDPHSLPWIEYLHTGASKIWYGIPAKASEKFKNAMKKIVPEYCTDKPLWLSSESTMIPPNLLIKHGSSLSRTIQKSGQFVIIFPESFTSTICCGYCVSESVYFAPTLWLDLAEKAFQDIHSSCESPAFSLERLLLSIANDPKPQLKALQKVLPMIENIRSKEMKLRTQLNENGVKEIERVPLSEPQDKKKKPKSLIHESGPECEICSTPCYLSRVIHTQEDTVYCLPHALDNIQKKNLKFCKLLYTYDEKDFEEIIKRIHDLLSQLPNNSAKKKSPKKKMLSVSEK